MELTLAPRDHERPGECSRPLFSSPITSTHTCTPCRTPLTERGRLVLPRQRDGDSARMNADFPAVRADNTGAAPPPPIPPTWDWCTSTHKHIPNRQPHKPFSPHQLPVCPVQPGQLRLFEIPIHNNILALLVLTLVSFVYYHFWRQTGELRYRASLFNMLADLWDNVRYAGPWAPPLELRRRRVRQRRWRAGLCPAALERWQPLLGSELRRLRPGGYFQELEAALAAADWTGGEAWGGGEGWCGCGGQQGRARYLGGILSLHRVGSAPSPRCPSPLKRASLLLRLHAPPLPHTHTAAQR